MANGCDHLRPDTTYAHIDALTGGELTDAEVIAARLEDPTRYGLCVPCAGNGDEAAAAPGCDACFTCLGERDIDFAGLRERIAATFKSSPSTAAEADLRGAYLRDVCALVAVAMQAQRVLPAADAAVLDAWEVRIAALAAGARS